VLLHGPCKGGLYPLPPSTSKFQKLVFHAIKIPIDRWHSCLGHPSRDNVRRIVSKNNLLCATFDNSGNSVCDAFSGARHINYHSNCPPTLHLPLCSLSFLTFGARLLNLLAARNIMSLLLTITVNSLGFI
jgi:hypothetical protein